MEDEYAGQGGSYLLDPKTGKRTLVERTLDPMFPNDYQTPVNTNGNQNQTPPAADKG